MTVIPMSSLRRAADASTASLALITDAVAECLFLADSIRQEWYREEEWQHLSAGAKAFYRERARMAFRLCDLDGACDLARHRLACALETGIAKFLSDDTQRAALLELDRDEIPIESDALVEELAAIGLNAIFKVFKGQDASQVSVARATEAETEIEEGR